jgi:hypothetical protein
LIIPFGDPTFMVTQKESQQNTYPAFLLHADRLLGLLAVMALMVGTTLLVIQIWEKDSFKWIWQIVGNMGVLLVMCILAITINRLLGRTKSIVVRIAHAALELSVIAGFVLSTLVIWQVTDLDVAWRAIGTISVLAIASCMGVVVSRMATR